LRKVGSGLAEFLGCLAGGIQIIVHGVTDIVPQFLAGFWGDRQTHYNSGPDTREKREKRILRLQSCRCITRHDEFSIYQFAREYPLSIEMSLDGRRGGTDSTATRAVRDTESNRLCAGLLSCTKRAQKAAQTKLIRKW
jgi:hypothetical protein